MPGQCLGDRVRHRPGARRAPPGRRPPAAPWSPWRRRRPRPGTVCDAPGTSASRWQSMPALADSATATVPPAAAQRVHGLLQRVAVHAGDRHPELTAIASTQSWACPGLGTVVADGGHLDPDLGAAGEVGDLHPGLGARRFDVCEPVGDRRLAHAADVHDTGHRGAAAGRRQQSGATCSSNSARSSHGTPGSAQTRRAVDLDDEPGCGADGRPRRGAGAARGLPQVVRPHPRPELREPLGGSASSRSSRCSRSRRPLRRPPPGSGRRASGRARRRPPSRRCGRAATAGPRPSRRGRRGPHVQDRSPRARAAARPATRRWCRPGPRRAARSRPSRRRSLQAPLTAARLGRRSRCPTTASARSRRTAPSFERVRHARDQEQRRPPTTCEMVLSLPHHDAGMTRSQRRTSPTRSTVTPTSRTTITTTAHHGSSPNDRQRRQRPDHQQLVGDRVGQLPPPGHAVPAARHPAVERVGGGGEDEDAERPPAGGPDVHAPAATGSPARAGPAGT